MRCIFKSINLNSTPTWPCLPVRGRRCNCLSHVATHFAAVENPRTQWRFIKKSFATFSWRCWMLHEICIKLTPSRLLLETIDHARPCRTVPYHAIHSQPGLSNIFHKIQWRNCSCVCVFGALWLVWLDLCLGIACFPQLFKDAIEMETPTRGLHNLSWRWKDQLERERERGVGELAEMSKLTKYLPEHLCKQANSAYD